MRVKAAQGVQYLQCCVLVASAALVDKSSVTASSHLSNVYFPVKQSRVFQCTVVQSSQPLQVRRASLYK